MTRWVDRLLPFDFSIVHTPGRALGMADYLSRHPSIYEGASIQAEKLFNDWFTVNVVKDVTPKVEGLENWRQPIRSRECENSERKDVNRLLTVHAPMQTSKESKEIVNPQNRDVMAFNSEKSYSKINDVYIQANAEDDRIIQKVKSLVQNKNNAIIARLPTPWREIFNSFSVSDNGLLYMDNRLVIPKNMRKNVLRAIHFGHVGRDAMLKEAADVWWPRVHREVVEKAKNCPQCQLAGKNLKCKKHKTNLEKFPNQLNRTKKLRETLRDPFKTQTKRKRISLCL